MTIFDLFSKRQKRLRGDLPDVYTYDKIPEGLRVQIMHIWNDALGTHNEYHASHTLVENAYTKIVGTLCREYGLFSLCKVYGHRDYYNELGEFFLEEKDTKKVLDVIELSFRVINKLTRDFMYRRRHDFDEIADEAIEELNARFKEHGIGYQFEEGEIIRVDSQLLHAEVIKPAIHLLNDKLYKGAQEEFLSAYEHYRHGSHKEALNDALKAFESTIKAICSKRKWNFNKNDTSHKLIQVCFDNTLIPSFWQSHFSGLRSLLEGGVPTGRNKLSGHGQGVTPTEVPDYIVSYILHMTGSAIVMLVKAEKEL